MTVAREPELADAFARENIAAKFCVGLPHRGTNGHLIVAVAQSPGSSASHLSGAGSETAQTPLLLPVT